MMVTTPKLEVLSPVGDRERLEMALLYGADAVYLAGKQFGMRTAPNNFSMEELQQAVVLAHSKGVKVYVTCNTMPRNQELAALPEFLQELQHIGVDAIIVADFGVLALAKRYAPKVEIHMSTQTGIVNYATAQALYELGASRVVLARELSLAEITEIAEKKPKELELEAFVHGAMCVSFSGRCLLSMYLNARDANRGDCSQPCRWEYEVVEKTRPNQPLAIEEQKEGTYFFNSKDLCMISHIPELVQAGVTSFKIEGRAKSAYYVAVTTAAYRAAVDHYLQHGKEPLPPWIAQETEKISHRPYTTGFYFGEQAGQCYEDGGYLRGYDVVAVAEKWQDGKLYVSQRNKFSVGETLDILQPKAEPFSLVVTAMENAAGETIQSAPHATMAVTLPCSTPVVPGAVLRRKR